MAAALALLTVVGFAASQCRPARAYQRLHDSDWLRTATPSEQRTAAHQALAFSLGDPHDAFEVLERHGDRSSIPFLRSALARQPKDEGIEVDCTWLHGKHALERVANLPTD